MVDTNAPDLPARSRWRGCLLGLAAGDALGTTLEFTQPGDFEPIHEMVGGGPFELRPGEWTDDTSMALCLAASLVECGGFNARDQMDRYLRWRNEGYMSSNGRCFDIGGTINAALYRYQQHGDPLIGSTDQYSAGNGALMRLAPVPMFYAADPQQALTLAGESARTTHGTPATVDANRYYAALLLGALHGIGKDRLLAGRYTPLPGYWERRPLQPDVDNVAAGSFRRRQPPEIRGCGYVVKSLEAALWAFYTTESFEDGCLAAVNLGEDADTTGAIYGQLAGAYYGEEAIPARWREKLALRETIESLADSLLVSGRAAYTGGFLWKPGTPA